MKSIFWQIFAIARNEFRFGLRRGFPVLGMILVCGMTSLMVFWQILSGVETSYPDTIRLSSLARAWPVVTLLVPLILPLVSIISIPSDQEYKVGSWLFSLPLDGSIYLVGKIVGLLAVVLATWGISLSIHMLVYRIWIGPFDLRMDLELVLLGELPLVVWATALGFLMGAWIRSRKNAILVGVMAGFGSLYAWGYLFPMLTNAGSYFSTGVFSSGLAFIGRNTLEDFLLSSLGMLPDYIRPVAAQEAILTLFIASFVLIFLAVSARLWISARDQI